MEFKFQFFKVMNNMKFEVAVLESMIFWEICGDFFWGGAKLLYASIFFIIYEKFS